MTTTIISTTINHGIHSGFGNYGTDLTITGSGVINAPLYGVYAASGDATMLNEGVIHANTLGVLLNITTASALSGQAGLTNSASGFISGGSIGVALASTIPTQPYFTNAGTVQGADTGVYLHNGVLQNSGTITGTGAGVAARSGTITNTGLISGSRYGVYLYGPAINFTDTGTILGGLYAIDAINTVTLSLGNSAVLDGTVLDHTGAGVLNLSGTQGTLTGLGTRVRGFSTINLAPGASWTLEEDAAGLATGQTINGFTLGDTLVLDGFSAASETLTSTGLVLNNGSYTETLDIAGSFSTADFTITDTLAATTITTAVAPLFLPGHAPCHRARQCAGGRFTPRRSRAHRNQRRPAYPLDRPARL